MADRPTTREGNSRDERARGAGSPAELSDAQAMLLMAYADGELSGEELAEAEALLAAHSHASVAVHDLNLAKRALQHHLLADEPNVSADLSRVRGRVLTKMPAPQRAPVAAEGATSGWFGGVSAWLRHFKPAQLGLVAGVAMAAVLLAMVLRPDTTGPAPELQPQTAQAGHEGHVDHATETALAKTSDAEKPSVIIEDMELDGGTVLFEGAEKPGETMIIWHIQPDEGGAG